MIANRWIDTSCKVYATFLSLYPKEHRAEYGESMRQVFADQCRSAYKQKGILGVLLLWLRTLPDLGYTAFLEHITTPNAGLGLMEPIPNTPLPWKGVFLILLPGLVYLVSQVAQLTGQPWYLTVYYRAAFFLILPVLAVWAITRRFPIWGLIPVGLLYRLLQEIGYQLIVLHPGVFSSNPLLNIILIIARHIQKELLIMVVLFALVTLALAWRYARQQKPSPTFWFLIGLYVLAAIVQVTRDLSWWIKGLDQALYFNGDMWGTIKDIVSWSLYDTTAFLCLIFIGTLFTRRHGFFAILIPMGYILPTMVIGVGGIEPTNPAIYLTIVYGAVLIYRSLLSLIAPVWMSRSSSLASKKRAVLVSIAIALGIHALMQLYSVMLYSGQNPFSAEWAISVVLVETKLISAILLGILMYQNISPTTDSPENTRTRLHPSEDMKEVPSISGTGFSNKA